jgi:uncharacterized membrane protein
LWRALCAISPQHTTYLMSFLTLGIFWNSQQFNRFARTDRRLTWIHIVLLFAVSIMPFSTKLLSEFIVPRVALLCYWIDMLVFGAVLYLSWFHAKRAVS